MQPLVSGLAVNKSVWQRERGKALVVLFVCVSLFVFVSVCAHYLVTDPHGGDETINRQLFWRDKPEA